MSETRKLAAILVADIVGYSRLAGADEERILARLRTLRSDLIDPTVAVHHGRFVKRTGDGAIIEFRSVVDAVRCAIEVQNGMVERNAGLTEGRRIEFRVGIHIGDVVEEADGDLMGDGVNIAARLEGVAEPGAICLSGAAYEQVRDKVKEEFADLGEQPLKNIARPMRIYAVKIGPDGARSTPHPLSLQQKEPPHLSIVVLPFANLAGDPEHDYFVDGVTESLTTDLSRVSGSFVIARNTAFTYRGRPVDVRQIGRDLNVRYVLEGSIQRGGHRMRVNVQLVEAKTGKHLWAERFDKPLADLFDMQDEIVSRLANQLGTELVAAEARHSESRPNPDSIDLYFQGMAWLNKGRTHENMKQARVLFERALRLDPSNFDALIGMARIDVLLVTNYLTMDRRGHLAAAEATLTKALSLAPNDASTHCTLGMAKIQSNRAVEGIADCERALSLNPSYAIAHGVIAVAKSLLGQFEEAVAQVREALRISPRGPNSYAWMTAAGFAKMSLGADEEAVAWHRRAVEINRNFPMAHFFLAAALANTNKLDDARSEVRAGLALDPTFTTQRLTTDVASDNPVYLTALARCVDSMRKAGVPEG